MPTPPKRTTAPAFQFYPSDFLSSPKVMAMTMTERGAYITLLSICWMEGGLPDDPVKLARWCKMPLKQFARLWPNNLQGCFTLVRGSKLINERLERERLKQVAYREKQAEYGKKSAAARQGSLKVASTRARKGSLNSSSSISNLQSSKDSDPSDLRLVAHPIKAFLTVYEEQFVALCGAKPDIQRGRDTAIAKRTIDKHGADRAAALLRLFFLSADPFIQKSGYGLNVFAGQINKLLVGERPLAATGTDGRGRTGAPAPGKYDGIEEQD